MSCDKLYFRHIAKYNTECKYFYEEYVGNPGSVPCCEKTGEMEPDCRNCQSEDYDISGNNGVWIPDGVGGICPRCGSRYNMAKEFDYCPKCGSRNEWRYRK